MVVVYDDGVGNRNFSNIRPMFGGMCVHVSTGTTFTFKAEGPDQRLWLYRGGHRSEDGFEWHDGEWIAIAERVDGFIHILSDVGWSAFGNFEGDDYVIDVYSYMLLRNEILERRELWDTPPNPFQVL